MVQVSVYTQNSRLYRMCFHAISWFSPFLLPNGQSCTQTCGQEHTHWSARRIWITRHVHTQIWSKHRNKNTQTHSFATFAYHGCPNPSPALSHSPRRSGIQGRRSQMNGHLLLVSPLSMTIIVAVTQAPSLQSPLQSPLIRGNFQMGADFILKFSWTKTAKITVLTVEFIFIPKLVICCSWKPPSPIPNSGFDPKTNLLCTTPPKNDLKEQKYV